MSASFGFQRAVAGIVSGPAVSAQVMIGARQLGLRLDQRAPGVEFGLNASGPSIQP